MAVKVGDNTVTDAACLSARPKHVAEVAYKNQVVMDTQEVDYGTVTYLEKIKLQKGLEYHRWVSDVETTFVAKEYADTLTDPKDPTDKGPSDKLISH
ncbi:hypothetical protein LguiA_016247 [Lonicera macranthoides]